MAHKWGWFSCDSCGVFGEVPLVIINEKKGIAICLDCVETLYKENFTTEILTVVRKTISEEVRSEILKKYDHKCIECGSAENLQIDHIKPFVKGGTTELVNLQVLCRVCNCKKSDRYSVGV